MSFLNNVLVAVTAFALFSGSAFGADEAIGAEISTGTGPVAILKFLCTAKEGAENSTLNGSTLQIYAGAQGEGEAVRPIIFLRDETAQIPVLFNTEASVDANSKALVIRYESGIDLLNSQVVITLDMAREADGIIPATKQTSFPGTSEALTEELVCRNRI